jgi:5-keto 4-deoxyuronate isomerase
MALPLGTDVEYIGQGASGGVCVGSGATAKIGFYGKAPSAQRAYSSAVHASSALATSTDFGATQLAAVQEIQKTLVALGIWATA